MAEPYGRATWPRHMARSYGFAMAAAAAVAAAAATIVCDSAVKKHLSRFLLRKNDIDKFHKSLKILKIALKMPLVCP